jgi:hypothetical protein
MSALFWALVITNAIYCTISAVICLVIMTINGYEDVEDPAIPWKKQSKAGKFSTICQSILLSLLIIPASNIPIIGTAVHIWLQLNYFDEKSKNKNKDVKDDEIQRIRNLYYEIDSKIFSGYVYELKDIYHKYVKIVEQEINVVLVNNRMETLLILVQSVIMNEVDLHDEKLQDLIAATDAFFAEILASIDIAKDIERKKFEILFIEKADEYIAQTKSMKENFEKMNSNMNIRRDK